MNKHSPIYRIIAQATALVVLMSTLLPAGFAMGEAMMDDCDMMDMRAGTPMETVAMLSDCCSMEHNAEQPAMMSTQDCQCTLEQTNATIPAESTLLIKQLQQWSVLIFNSWDDEDVSTHQAFTVPLSSISKRFIPLFLLNSVFLN